MFFIIFEINRYPVCDVSSRSGRRKIFRPYKHSEETRRFSTAIRAIRYCETMERLPAVREMVCCETDDSLLRLMTDY